MRNSLKLAAVLVAVTATSASAQGRGRNTDGVPPGQRPAAGMCRVWINGVPPGQQPAATDCATARANLPANARIIYGTSTNRTTTTNRTFTRRRQLANGSWVLDRLTRDANGNLVTISSSPLVTGNGVNAGRRGDDNEANDNRKHERKTDKREMKGDRKDDKREMKGDRKDDKRDDKGRKDKDNEQGDDDNG